MNRLAAIRQILSIALLAVVIAGVIWCGIPVHVFLANQALASAEEPRAVKLFADMADNANAVILKIDATVEDLQGAINGRHGLKQLLYNVDLATAQIARASTTIEIASREEHARTLAASDAAVKALGDLDGLVGSARAQIEGVLPALTGTLQATTKALDTLDGPDGLMAQSGAAVKAAGNLLANPHIPQMLEHIDQMTGNAAVGIEHGSNILAIVEGDIDPRRPKPSVKQVLLSKGLNALPQLFLDWLVRAIVHEKVDVTSLPSGGK